MLGVDCYVLSLKGVPFDEERQRFGLLAGRVILDHETFVDEVITKMDLPGAIGIRVNEHGRCEACEGFEV